MRRRTKRLAVDIDEVIFPFNSVISEYHNEKYGTTHALGDIYTYDIFKLWGVDTAEAVRRCDECLLRPGMAKNISPIVGAVEAIRRLRDYGRELVAVTGRWESLFTFTRYQFDIHLPGLISEIHLCHHWMPNVRPKADVCAELDIDTIIDDRLEMALECAERGMTVYLFGDYPWNKCESLPPNVRRVRDWAELFPLLIA